MSDSSSGSHFPGIGVIITVLFIALKLTHNIDLPWWWVLAPIWIPLAFLGVVIIIMAVVSAWEAR